MNKKRILLFGATGMAGHMIYYYLKDTDKYDIINVVYRTKLNEESIIVDITNKDAVAEIVQHISPDLIINCIGVLIKGSKEHPDNAIYVNAYFPHLLKKYSDEIGAKLIHLSTDCVFSGKKGHYAEEDFRDADDVYGRSKALGEIINDKDLTIRTSIIGPELKKNGEGLFHWFMFQSGEIRGFKNVIWGGVTTLELAKALDAAIELNQTGLINLSNGQGITKYDLLVILGSLWKEKKIKIIPFASNSTDKSIARSEKFNYKVVGYSIMMKELYNWMNEYQALYKRIYSDNLK